MIKYASLLPHSPLTVHKLTGKQDLYQKLKPALQNVVKALQDQEIQHIIFIAGHPSFHRPGFSVYIHPEYHVAFKDFGQLQTLFTAKPSWSIYTLLREKLLNTPLSIIDHKEIDYGHAIPLFLLNELSPLNKIKFLFINDSPEKTLAEKQAFGEEVGKILQILPEPVAVIASGDFHPIETEADKEKNMEFKHRIEGLFANGRALDSDQENCYIGPLTIAKGILQGSELKYKEVAFEHSGQMSFLVAELKN